MSEVEPCQARCFHASTSLSVTLIFVFQQPAREVFYHIFVHKENSVTLRLRGNKNLFFSNLLDVIALVKQVLQSLGK